MPSLLTAGKLFITGWRGRAVVSIDRNLRRKTSSPVILHFCCFNERFLENVTKMQSLKWRKTTNKPVCADNHTCKRLHSAKTVLDDHADSGIQQNDYEADSGLLKKPLPLWAGKRSPKQWCTNSGIWNPLRTHTHARTHTQKRREVLLFLFCLVSIKTTRRFKWMLHLRLFVKSLSSQIHLFTP